MIFQTLLTLLLVTTSAFANPIRDLYRRDTELLYRRASNATYNATNTSSVGGTKLKVIVAGGTVPRSNYTTSPDVNITTLFNASSALNATQLYQIASDINSTFEDEEYKGVVITGNEGSLESLGFFTSLIIHSAKPVVVTQDALHGIIVANSTEAAGRGSLVVWKDWIFSGVLASTGGPKIGIIGSINEDHTVTWFYDPALPSLIGKHSAIRNNYTNFTNTEVQSEPVIPIVYDDDYDSSLLQSLSGQVSGVVVVSSGNSTESVFGSSNSSLPIVYSYDGAFGSVSKENIPEGTIASGYLDPLKSKLLLSVAVANGVTDTTALQHIFS